jgi:hypothetical protein
MCAQQILSRYFLIHGQKPGTLASTVILQLGRWMK